MVHRPTPLLTVDSDANVDVNVRKPPEYLALLDALENVAHLLEQEVARRRAGDPACLPDLLIVSHARGNRNIFAIKADSYAGLLQIALSVNTAADRD